MNSSSLSHSTVPPPSLPPVSGKGDFVPLPSHSSCLSFMMQCQSVGDLCVVGEKVREGEFIL